MQVVWQRDSTESQVTLPAHAVWCRDLGWLELVGARSDTGVGLAVFPADTGYAGSYRLLPPQARTGTTKGVGAVAVRWFSRDELLAYEGLDGAAELRQEPAGLAGSIRARLRVPMGDDSLRLEAEFRGIPVTEGGIECRPVERDDSTNEGGAEVLH